MRLISLGFWRFKLPVRVGGDIPFYAALHPHLPLIIRGLRLVANCLCWLNACSLYVRVPIVCAVEGRSGINYTPKNKSPGLYPRPSTTPICPKKITPCPKNKDTNNDYQFHDELGKKKAPAWLAEAFRRDV